MAEPAPDSSPAGEADVGTAVAVVVRYGRRTSGGGDHRGLDPGEVHSRAVMELRFSVHPTAFRESWRVVEDAEADENGRSLAVLRKHVPAGARRSYWVTRKGATLCQSMPCPW
ncbi:hypothetical protein [Streptomyces sp. NBC_01618]|uniref:hypothetical protein n=1 Tax=Streptomyces sp. NBC_01618 TaxID=2975900 RepID=UPI003863E1B5|nr:hypothetical protein OH735_13340 [Streptomyces sp. NBC_01618]